jgi:hypothetical protein
MFPRAHLLTHFESEILHQDNHIEAAVPKL